MKRAFQNIYRSSHSIIVLYKTAPKLSTDLIKPATQRLQAGDPVPN